VAQIEDARVLDNGFVISPDNQLLSDVSVIINPKAPVHPAYHAGGVGPVRKVSGNVALLTTYAGRGYYHWMMDVLPRLELIRLANYKLEHIDKFIVNCYVTSYQIETLKTLGIPREKLILSESSKHLSVEQLILPSLTNIYQTVPKWSCDFIHNTFLDLSGHHQTAGRRIYISRSLASLRHVLNEKKLVNLLKKRGFEIVVLESLTISDQASLFESASVVVAPHGAGLTNLVFCKARTKILEIIHPKVINLMFWTIASHRDLDYYYFFANGELAEPGGEVFLNSDDLEIDLNAMETILNKMGVI
jgi:capsular polysaccharide biosynthesis protein